MVRINTYTSTSEELLEVTLPSALLQSASQKFEYTEIAFIIKYSRNTRAAMRYVHALTYPRMTENFT